MRTLDVTFLGTGTSVGVPVIGCRCQVCTSEDSRDKRLRSSVLITTPKVQFVVDTGPDFRSQCLRAGIRHLDAALFTHAHTDHIMGFDDLRRFTVGADATLPVYARPSVLADLARIYEFAFNGQNRYPGYLKPEPHPVLGPFDLGDLTVTPLPVSHGKVETIGYLFSHHGHPLLAYLPDCKSVSDQATNAIRGVHSLVLDALRHSPHPTHMNIDEATAFSSAVGARHTYFTHLADEILHARDSALLPDRITLAHDGLTFRIPLTGSD
ncbi:MBL fold metallo-hydrolase [soil metagenome]